MIALENVHVRYGARAILDGVSLEVAAGECVGLLGPSGAGKSTLLRVIAGEQAPGAGDVVVAGWHPTAAGKPRRPPPGLLGIVYQDPVASLDRLWSARRCVEEPLLALADMPRDERLRRVAQALLRVRLGHIDPETRVTRLSVGQSQRVALARALVARPRVLLADEPTSALDPTTAASIIRLLREAADAGAAVLIVSHNPTLLASFCDRGMALADGRLQPVTHWPTDDAAVVVTASQHEARTRPENAVHV